MTYHAGIGPRMVAFGLQPQEPHVTCDGCGARKSCYTSNGDAASWIRSGKAPPGWQLIRRVDDETGDLFRRDYCKSCRARGGKA